MHLLFSAFGPKAFNSVLDSELYCLCCLQIVQERFWGRIWVHQEAVTGLFSDNCLGPKGGAVASIQELLTLAQNTAFQCFPHHGTHRKVSLCNTQDNQSCLRLPWQLWALPSCPKGQGDQCVSPPVPVTQWLGSSITDLRKCLHI